MKTLLTLSACILLTSLTAACTNHVDPYEKCNRKVYAFNSKLDRWALRPVAKGYDKITPPLVQKGVTNFFVNVDSTTTIPNDILQGKLVYAVSDGWRFLINSTFGIGGLFDVATRLGIPKHHEDFGLTLAYWGVKQQPYLMLPVLGPSTPRDGIGLIADYMTSPWPYVRPYWASTVIVGLKTINLRAQLLPADQLLDTAFDPYVFVRDAYLQKREQQIANNKLTYNQFAAQNRNNQLSKTNSDPDADEVGNNIASMSTETPAQTTAQTSTTSTNNLQAATNSSNSPNPHTHMTIKSS